MLKRRNHIWEAGCADTFGSWLVATAKDFDPVFVADVRNRMDKRWRFDCEQHDLLVSPFPGQFDGAYALDVIEHIPAEKERSFVGNLVNSPTPEGVLILGWRSLETQACASPPSEAGHVNGKTGKMMRSLLEHF
jgi:2-polyprenyl-3-methyl-5-hydroxy-6-metoxy-1,4-benzoquinol methylase